MEKKSLIVAYLFLFYFGAFGVHRFYLRRPESGLVYLFTGGVFMLGVVFDFFALPFLVAHANQ
jgi:TM2 domain-containing membrane protein YozV